MHCSFPLCSGMLRYSPAVKVRSHRSVARGPRSHKRPLRTDPRLWTDPRLQTDPLLLTPPTQLWNGREVKPSHSDLVRRLKSSDNVAHLPVFPFIFHWLWRHNWWNGLLYKYDMFSCKTFFFLFHRKIRCKPSLCGSHPLCAHERASIRSHCRGHCQSKCFQHLHHWTQANAFHAKRPAVQWM